MNDATKSRAFPDKALLEQVRSRKWFYEFELPDGTRTECYVPPGVEGVHTTRLAMLEAALERRFGKDLSGLSAVDLACHEGWFAFHLARRGAAPVLGLDMRQSHISDATLMARAMGIATFSGRVIDIENARTEEVGAHDITLMLGLLYHLENPMRALRLARAVTRKALYIETQVVPHMSGVIDWGSYVFQRHMVGVFGIVDETGETHAPEAGASGICLAPSIESLEWLLRKVGFTTVERLAPPAGGYEQHVAHKRVMFAAYVD